jgi:hypothetical protein
MVDSMLSRLEKPDGKVIAFTFTGTESFLTQNSKKSRVVTSFFFHRTDKNEFRFSMQLDKYNRSVFVTCDNSFSVGILNGRLVGNHVYTNFKEHQDVTISFQRHQERVNPIKSSTILLDELDSQDIRSAITYSNGFLEAYPVENNTEWSSYSVNNNSIYLTSWIMYYQTEDGEQLLAMYCPSENPDFKQFSKITGLNDNDLESLAFNILSATSVDLKQYFQPCL